MQLATSMKLNQLHEAVYDHDHYSLLQKVAVELGYQRLRLHDSAYHYDDDTDEEAIKYHYDGAPDIETAIKIVRMPLEEKASAWNGLHQLANLRSLDEELVRITERYSEGPLVNIRGIKQLSEAYKVVAEQQDWVRTSAKNTLAVVMLLNGIKGWAKKTAERGSDESFKISVAKATLKKLGIPLEGE